MFGKSSVMNFLIQLQNTLISAFDQTLDKGHDRNSITLTDSFQIRISDVYCIHQEIFLARLNLFKLYFINSFK